MQKGDFRIGTYLLAVPSFVFFALSLTGCVSTSSGIPDIFTAKIANGVNTTTSTILEVRIGYFGICVSFVGRLDCLPSAGKTSGALLRSLNASTYNVTISASESMDMLDLALVIQTKIFICLFVVAGLLYTLGVLSLFVLKRSFTAQQDERITRRRYTIRGASLALLWISTAFTLASALSVNQMTSALDYITDVNSTSRFRITGRKTLNVLQWLAFAFTLLFVLGVSSIFTRKGNTLGSSGSSTKTGDTNRGSVPLPPLPPPPPPFAPRPLPPPPPPPLPM
ncbi:hypothetical protein K458DRAFT_408135 [Lentithecium fluviatile CBS 122367]|uniref:Uncharacterized protein n=1 Tax=Lentithecium fluviatile CBS 122367 TaxID=1168545 RepID=A0A6G1ING3_9PLEO|nr:hypothetical protein K458DRAFT_408135 [Lentithecium fluviatile CBS 122367]